MKGRAAIFKPASLEAFLHTDKAPQLPRPIIFLRHRHMHMQIAANPATLQAQNSVPVVMILPHMFPREVQSIRHPMHMYHKLLAFRTQTILGSPLNHHTPLTPSRIFL
jgi:hypothetical protein